MWVNKLEDSKIPTWEHLSILDKNIFKILPLFIVAKRQVPQDYLGKLTFSLSWKGLYVPSKTSTLAAKIASSKASSK